MAVPYAFVTLLTSDFYLPGALALASSLNDVHTKPAVPPEVDFQTVCLVTPETVDISAIKLLRKAFNVVIGVEIIAQNDDRGLKLLGRPDLNTVLTKLHVFRLTQYSKIIFLDADVLPVRPLSHLFTLPHEFSAVPDVGWPDIFNSGMLVLTPGEDKFSELNDLLKIKGTWDGGDQGLLNEWRGSNWNRLSFTYNTTPTAAYTYAPAYERYGSQISAIHFIGPNKPWSSLAWRPPSADSGQFTEAESKQAYDYESLVNQWYAVYDKHYRTQSIAPETDFEVRKYTSAWDEHQNASSSYHSRQKTGSGYQATASGGALGLEDLRRIAIEGMSSFHVTSGASGEGEYRSMPIEGRVDLMRPSRGKIEQSAEVEDHSTPLTHRVELPAQSQPTMDTLPTPRPHEIPPAPYMQPHSLPATPGLHQPPQPPQHHPAAHDNPHQGQLQSGNTPYHSESSSQSPQHNEQQHQNTSHLTHYSSQQQHQQHQPPSQEQSPSQYQHTESHQLPSQHEHQEPSHEQHHPEHRPHHEHHEHHEHREHHPQRPPRPPSPPMLIWNPAVDPPPNNPPPASAFPPDTYFPNVWDKSPSKQHDQAHQHHESPEQNSGVFFQPPPLSEIPEPLRRQGHYRQVTGEDVEGHTPSPDRTKVKSVFPWEEKPRHLPGRVFPTADAPTPALFMSPSSSTPSTASSPETPVARAAPPVQSPTRGLPFNLSYKNAWDTIPSIQKYASRLVRPQAPVLPLAPAFDPDEWKNRSWEERAEASSRDGDVEDEGDDEGDDAAGEQAEVEDDSDKESASRRRSRRGSTSISASYLIKGRKKEYRVRGVQTVPREMRSEAIQVSIDVPKITNPVQEQERKGPHHSPGGRRKWSPNTVAKLMPPIQVQEASVGAEGSLATAPASAQLTRTSSMERPSATSPSGVRSPREFAFPTSPPARLSPQPSTPPHHKISSLPPALTTRKLSNESSSVASPQSSVGPLSPEDAQPITMSTRKAGRVWDPARGVDLFKRGSEEVLARFLKMGSWEDEAAH